MLRSTLSLAAIAIMNFIFNIQIMAMCETLRSVFFQTHSWIFYIFNFITVLSRNFLFTNIHASLSY